MKYNFYYDETEHSRAINHNTISADNYYDNFITVIVGWHSNNTDNISKRYLAFEEKYAYRKTKGELKSLTLKQKQFEHGFASLNSDNVKFLEDYFSLYDDTIFLYFAIMEMRQYWNSMQSSPMFFRLLNKCQVGFPNRFSIIMVGQKITCELGLHSIYLNR